MTDHRDGWEWLASAIRKEKVRRKIGNKTVAYEVGLSISTIKRVLRGGRPEVNTFEVLKAWMEGEPK